MAPELKRVARERLQRSSPQVEEMMTRQWRATSRWTGC